VLPQIVRLYRHQSILQRPAHDPVRKHALKDPRKNGHDVEPHTPDDIGLSDSDRPPGAGRLTRCVFSAVCPLRYLPGASGIVSSSAAKAEAPSYPWELSELPA
jgi:hypothetical protein